MKILMVLLVVGICCCTLFADTMDPTIILRPGADAMVETGPFSFVLGSSGSSSFCTQVGGGNSPFTCGFTNASGGSWTSLLVEVSGSVNGHHNGSVKCPKAGDATNPPLTNCLVQTATSLLFFNGPGISDDMNFSLVFGKSGGIDFFLHGTDVTVVPNVPEPGTMILLASGLTAAWARWRFRRTT
jgi:hypothetical protein